jgi:hypothetical protein
MWKNLVANLSKPVSKFLGSVANLVEAFASFL